jgi:hypothetical protein
MATTVLSTWTHFGGVKTQTSQRARCGAPGGESGTDRHPTVYAESYVEYVQKLGHEAPGIYS